MFRIYLVASCWHSTNFGLCVEINDFHFHEEMNDSTTGIRRGIAKEFNALYLVDSMEKVLHNIF